MIVCKRYAHHDVEFVEPRVKTIDNMKGL